MKKQPMKQWIKFAIAAIICILFTIWIGSLWVLIVLPFIFDVYISKFIHWTWWKESKNPAVRQVMEWVDAIVFALIAVYIINLFFFQNYQIPTSSLEKTLLVGDFLFVSKVAYGPRMPNTPIAFPLVQNTLPILNCKSYLETPEWGYHRLKGFGHVKRNDIVVFNFPAGDTVTLKDLNPDYYTSCYEEGYSFLKSQNPGAQPNATECYQYGRQIIRDNPQKYGQIIYRPVDRRENYVKRCVGLPGDTLQIIQNQVYIDKKILYDQPGVQYNYLVQTNGAPLTNDIFNSLDVSKDDRQLLTQEGLDNDEILAGMGFQRNVSGQFLPVYDIPLTRAAYNKLKAMPFVISIKCEPDWFGGDVFPLGYGKGWTRGNFGPIWIPKKGATIAINTTNLSLYQHIIANYEHNKLSVNNGIIYINGKPATHYTFKMNYYWMMGDNRDNSADSRYWGFVPEDHIVGQPLFVWLSLDKDKGFPGNIRWNRFFHSATH
ncbi:S26 family signal peptidase [Microbacter margulisiae]|uniref:Signal peptidase I n=1 Tax=Microbacter margulisiae TaxID=1350067 RepID=A0A7W5H353_9PORP|nr:S26 family signal peptidase [Microbacter margulisiae]MBB3188254.1 signal peptidase I [Microbacter margulisiae]